MKRTILSLLLFLFCAYSYAQYPTEAKKLVNEGVDLHDIGKYEEAISKYDKALELDSNNVLALGEKAFTLRAINKYEESIFYCQKAIEHHPGETALKSVYSTYAMSLKGMGKVEQAIEIYNQGIKVFPDYYQLYYNKGVTFAGLDKNDEALLCFQKSIMLNPSHASSHNGIASVLYKKSKKIPSLLAYCRFLILEPQSSRAAENLVGVQNIMRGNVDVTGKNSITININPKILADTTTDGKPNENSFMTTDLILSMDAALDYDKKNKKKNEVEQFIRKFESVCASLKETKEDNYGFYWDYYVPYFIEMNDRKLIETFAYIAFASREDAYIAKWLKSHEKNIDNFYDWSKSFAWKKH